MRISGKQAGAGKVHIYTASLFLLKIPMETVSLLIMHAVMQLQALAVMSIVMICLCISDLM